MFAQFDELAAMFLIVALPLGLGLCAEYVFELLRRGSGRGGTDETGEA